MNYYAILSNMGVFQNVELFCNKWLAKYTFIFVFLLNMMLFVIVYGSFTPHFNTNDDIGMLLRSSGLCIVSKPSAFLLFSHVFIGYLLKGLYSYSATIPWYGLYFIFTLFFSYSSCFYLMLKREPTIHVVFCYVIFFVLIGVHLLIVLQFSILSAISFFVGCLLIVYDIPSDRGSKNEYVPSFIQIIGILLVFWGFMIRWRVAILIGLMFTPFLLLNVIQHKERKQWMFKLGICFIFIVLGCVGLDKINKIAYSQEPGYEDFFEFNHLRSDLFDNNRLRNVNKYKRKTILSTVNWSWNDYQMGKKWFFMDKEKYSIDNFKYVNKLLRLEQRKNNTTIKKLTNDIFGIFRLNLGVNVLIGLFLIWLIKGGRVNSFLKLLMLIFWVVFFVMLIAYLFRFPPIRIIYGMFFFISLLAIFLIKSNSQEENIKYDFLKKACFAVFLYLIFVNVNRCVEMSTNAIKVHNETSIIINKLSGGESAYVSWGAGISWTGILPLKSIDGLEKFRVFSLGVGQRTVNNSNFGSVENIYLRLLEDDVYLLIKPSIFKKSRNILVRYMKENLNKDVRIIKVKTIMKKHVYKVKETIK